jgi:hypothetical protein
VKAPAIRPQGACSNSACLGVVLGNGLPEGVLSEMGHSTVEDYVKDIEADVQVLRIEPEEASDPVERRREGGGRRLDLSCPRTASGSRASKQQNISAFRPLYQTSS